MKSTSCSQIFVLQLNSTLKYVSENILGKKYIVQFKEVIERERRG